MVYNGIVCRAVTAADAAQEGTVLAIDLHCHTKISDGSLGIEELLGIAKRRGVTTLSVTDHDTTAGATRAVIIGKRMGLNVIHGVEFSTRDKQRGTKAHLLCYRAAFPDRLEGLCRRVGESRRAVGLDMIRRVMRYYPITPDLVAKCATGSTNIYRQHIMHALIDAGYADRFYGELYEKLFGAEGVCASSQIDYPDTREVLTAIHEAGGIAVLAHPYQYGNEALLEELTDLGLDGVEVWHPSNDAEQTEQLQAFAWEHGLLATGGTDFHGMYSRTARAIGSVAVPDEAATALMNYKRKDG